MSTSGGGERVGAREAIARKLHEWYRRKLTFDRLDPYHRHNWLDRADELVALAALAAPGDGEARRLIARLVDPWPCEYDQAGCTRHISARPCPHQQARDWLAASPPVDAGDQFAKLFALPYNWDTYGSPRISLAAIERAQAFLMCVSVVPCSDGGVQLEWHQDGHDIEVKFDPSGAPAPVDAGQAERANRLAALIDTARADSIDGPIVLSASEAAEIQVALEDAASAHLACVEVPRQQETAREVQVHHGPGEIGCRLDGDTLHVYIGNELLNAADTRILQACIAAGHRTWVMRWSPVDAGREREALQQIERLADLPRYLRANGHRTLGDVVADVIATQRAALPAYPEGQP